MVVGKINTLSESLKEHGINMTHQLHKKEDKVEVVSPKGAEKEAPLPEQMDKIEED